MNNLLAILFGIALVILAYLVYVISRFITRLTSTTTIYDNNIKIIIEIYENGSSKYEVIYSKSNSYLSSIIKKMPENSTYLDFLNVFLEIDSIFFDYEIKYLSNRQDAAKYLGTTNDVKEIIKQVDLLKKYH